MVGSEDWSVDWLMVYIEEAHATNEWPVRSGRYVPDGKPVEVEQPKTTERRVEVCKEFLGTYGVPTDGAMSVVVDSPEADNPFERAYAPWPVRMYVIEDGKMEFISAPTECTHEVGDLRAWLEQRFK